MPSCNSARVKRSQYTNRPKMSVFIGSFVSSAIPRQSETSDETKPQNVTDIYILAHVYCGQTAGWMKTPLGTEVDLGPGHIVLDGVQALRSFRPMSIVATVAHLSYC